jgi:HEAT repeat protein
LMAPAPYNAVALTFAFSLVLSIVRRWQWFEADRQIFLSNQDESSFRILKPNGRNQDLRDEALTALATIFFLVPIALLQLQTAYGWFDATPDTDLIEWAGFVGAELAKAVPFVDWAEVYAVTSDSPIKAVDMHALHAVFAVRVLFDLLLIASLVQGAQIMGRLARQRKLLRDGKIDLVDPLLENEEFLRAFHEGWFWFESNPFVDFAFRRFLTRGQGWWNNNHYKVERLIAIIRNKTHWDRRIRIAAARLAGKHQDPHKFLDDLVVTLKDTKDDSSVRMAVAHALAEIKNSAALDALIAVLRNKDDRSRIRAVAGRALGQIGDPAAVKPLIAVLLDNKDRHQVRQSAALALGDIQDPGAVEPLISVLLSNEVGESVYGYEARALRRAAAEALGKIRDPRAVNPLLEILMDKNEDDWLRKIVALALGHIGDERAVEPLIAILQNKRRKLADLRRAAARALGGIGGERAVAALNEAASKDRDLLVRLEAQLALKDIERREQAEPNAATPTQEASNRDSELEKRELRYERWLHRRASREHDFHRDAKMWGRKIWSRAWPWISG